MKKFLYPLPLLAALLCAFLLNCSNDGFEKPKPGDLATWAGLDSLDTRPVKCIVDESKPCYEISKSACDMIGGKEIDPEEKCISFDCGWTSKEVDYGGNSTLYFAFKSNDVAQAENCSLKEISYGNIKLDTINYTLLSSNIAGLSYSKNDTIEAKATVTCGDIEIYRYCKPLNIKSVPIEFNCGWTKDEVTYGHEKAALYFAFDPISVDIAQKECSSKKPKISYGNKTFVLDSEYTVSSSAFAGLSYSKKDTIVAEATVICGSDTIRNNCKPLIVDSVPGPEWTPKSGGLRFKKSDYKSNDSIYFYIGRNVDTSFVENTIRINNKTEAACGNIEIKIEGSPAANGTLVKAIASVNCEYAGKVGLDTISAKVLPNPVLGDCKLIGNWDAMMFKKDTLFMDVPIENNYGRCKLQNDTLPLKNYTGKINDITVRVVCTSVTGSTTTTSKKCNEEVFVADKFAEIKICHDPRVQVGPGLTVVEITCTNDGEPAKNFGCDCSGGDWSSSNIFTINGVKAQSGGCWAYAPIPADIASNSKKRVLIEYNKEIGCVAY